MKRDPKNFNPQISPWTGDHLEPIFKFDRATKTIEIIRPCHLEQLWAELYRSHNTMSDDSNLDTQIDWIDPLSIYMMDDGSFTLMAAYNIKGQELLLSGVLYNHKGVQIWPPEG